MEPFAGLSVTVWPSSAPGGLVWVGPPCYTSYNRKFINSWWERLTWFSSLSSSPSPSPNIRESDWILKPIVIMKKLICRASVLQSRQTEKGPGKLRPGNDSQAFCNQTVSLCTTLLGASWAQACLTRAMCMIPSLFSRGEGSHRMQPGCMEQPIYFCFLIFIAFLLYPQLPCVPSRDLSWVIF